MSAEPRRSATDPHEHAGALRYEGHADTPARVQARHRNRRARATRAALTLLACWGLAIVAVFLPVLHFVLVPGLLLLGPVLAWSRLHEARTLLALDGQCPACAAHVTLTLAQPWRERTVLRCESCGRQLLLELPPAHDE